MRDQRMLSQLFRLLDIITETPDNEQKVAETAGSIRTLLHHYEEEYIDFRLICDHLESTLFITDQNGIVRYVNPSYIKKTRLDPAHLIGRSAEELNMDNVTQCDVIPRVIKERKPVSGIGYAKATDYRGFIVGIPVMQDDELKYVVTTDWDTIPIELPPLRERTEDIAYLAGRFLEEFNEKYHKSTILESDVMMLLRSYSWPGNVRELRNLMERLVILSVGGHITKQAVQDVLKISTNISETSGQTLKQAITQLEIMMIKNAIKEYGSKNKAAAALGIDHSTMVRKCQKYGLE